MTDSLDKELRCIFKDNSFGKDFDLKKSLKKGQKKSLRKLHERISQEMTQKIS